MLEEAREGEERDREHREGVTEGTGPQPESRARGRHWGDLSGRLGRSAVERAPWSTAQTSCQGCGLCLWAVRGFPG